VRKLGEEHIVPHNDEWIEAGAVPASVYRECSKAGLLVPIAGGKSIPKEWEKYLRIAGHSSSVLSTVRDPDQTGSVAATMDMVDVETAVGRKSEEDVDCCDASHLA
jgi:hypothetical protein